MRAAPAKISDDEPADPEPDGIAIDWIVVPTLKYAEGDAADNCANDGEGVVAMSTLATAKVQSRIPAPAFGV
jgi:hypothetical protein